MLKNKIKGSEDDDLKEWSENKKTLKVGELSSGSENDLGFISKIIDLSYDYKSIGCPEFNNLYGVKFIIKCLKHDYLKLK